MQQHFCSGPEQRLSPALANSFAAILCLRLLLGAGESVAYPAYSKIIAATFPEHLRGTANALIDAGSKMGPALGVLAGVKMVGWLSWRGMFVAIGGLQSLVANTLVIRCGQTCW